MAEHEKCGRAKIRESALLCAFTVIYSYLDYKLRLPYTRSQSCGYVCVLGVCLYKLEQFFERICLEKEKKNARNAYQNVPIFSSSALCSASVCASGQRLSVVFRLSGQSQRGVSHDCDPPGGRDTDDSGGTDGVPVGFLCQWRAVTERRLFCLCL